MKTETIFPLLNMVNTANCDTCRDQGACCKRFHVDIDVPEDMTAEALTVHLRAGMRPMTGSKSGEELPFDPIEPENAGNLPNTMQWAYSCSKLGPGGRCTIYNTRPCICRNYRPGEDALCVEWPGHGELEE